MKSQEVNIATARIEGLNKPPYYFEHHCYFAFDILFSDSSSLAFLNLAFIKAGDTEEGAVLFCNQIKENFKQAGIQEGDAVAILYGPDRYVRAIGRLGQDLWIDVEDKFIKKTFKELNIVITSLKVY